MEMFLQWKKLRKKKLKIFLVSLGIHRNIENKHVFFIKNIINNLSEI